MWYIYILKSIKTNHCYIGSTANIEKRLAKHNQGGNISTRNGQPWKIIYSESFITKTDALKREKQIKSYKGGQAFKNLLNNK